MTKPRRRWMTFVMSPMDWAVNRPPPPAEAVWRILWDHMDDRGICWPSQSRIAALTGLSAESVRRGVRWLSKGGYIKVQAGTGQTPSSYRILWSSSDPCRAYSKQFNAVCAHKFAGPVPGPANLSTPTDDTPGYAELTSDPLKENPIKDQQQFLLAETVEVGGQTFEAITPVLVVELWEETREDFQGHGPGELQPAKMHHLPDAALLLQELAARNDQRHLFDRLIDLFHAVHLSPFHRGCPPNKVARGSDFPWICRNLPTVLSYLSPELHDLATIGDHTSSAVR